MLSSGLLRHLVERYPTARFTIACGPFAAPLFAHVPRLERVITVTKRKLDAHWYALWKELRGTVWDIAVDLRRSLISYVIRVRRRHIIGPIPPAVHQVAHLSRLLDLAQPAAPFLYMDARHQVAASALIPVGAPVLALAPAAATSAKTWPAERFAELALRLTGADGSGGEGPCAGWRIALFGGRDDALPATPLVAALSRAGLGCIRVFGEPDLLTVTAALERCRAFVGNDSGLVHLAAVAGLPTLALFGATDTRRYRPWGGAVVQAPADPRGIHSLTNLTVDPVIAAFRNLVGGKSAPVS